tara:strand:+ start:767 stop:931 length:165 start_codon:yes stop_codon:yes gene_type:complete
MLAAVDRAHHGRAVVDRPVVDRPVIDPAVVGRVARDLAAAASNGSGEQPCNYPN